MAIDLTLTRDAVRAVRWHVCAIALATALLLLPACASIEVPPANLIAKEGAHATAVTRIGPVFVVRTVSVLPGSARAAEKFAVTDECRSGTLHVALRRQESAEPHAVPACGAVLAALQYAVVASDLPDLELKLTVDLISPGQQLIARTSSLATAASASARYAFALDKERDLAAANVVSTTAHETFHLLRGLSGTTSEMQEEERLAYTMGACAQLQALGWVRSKELPSVAFPQHAEGVSGSVKASNVAGVSVTKDLMQFMRDEMVTKDAPEGLAMAHFCQTALE
ncbi:hypothetical protein [Xanthomonas sacchari]|uniref:Uncharacterized protein n=1 Tax=Xanthomonas sacchari TaxID=56458 RepID=A0A2P5YZZ2_9XANT|nr:hypothetical protein [Xanthomonas sacchari]MDV0440332.1 hypothetical protein [Xanthomonas sacchari]PPU80558.1 hypothetical protein XsacCFBP4641_18100 [Xanthomonas sacchari]